MAKISKEFTYDLPDEYTKQTSDLGLTATATYEGPEFLYVFVDAATGRLLASQSFMPTKNETVDAEHAQIRAGLDERAILLRPKTDNTDAIIASLFIAPDTGESTDYPQKKYTLDGETEPYYVRPDPQWTNHTYQADEIEYDFTAGDWRTPFPWMKPWMTLEMHTTARDNIVGGARKFLEDNRANLTAAQIAAIEAFGTEMDAVYTKYAGIDAHMIPFPDDPTSGLVDGYDYNTDEDGLLSAE